MTENNDIQVFITSYYPSLDICCEGMGDENTKIQIVVDLQACRKIWCDEGPACEI